MTTVFVLATANPDKAREIGEILGEGLTGPFVVVPLLADGTPAAFLLGASGEVAEAVRSARAGDLRPDVEEVGATIEDNARIKAVGWCEALDLPAIADDTGLAVDALGGAPGVRSARFAGEGATYADNVARLLAEMVGVAPDRRASRFETVALARFPGGGEIVARRLVEGVITESPVGDGGFGYDPVFRPVEGDGRTFAEMSSAEKHAVSHRGRALRALAAALRASESMEA